jgi:hypothetical protein
MVEFTPHAGEEKCFATETGLQSGTLPRPLRAEAHE